MHTRARDNQNDGPKGEGDPCAEHEVTLLKNGHRWRLACATGEEPRTARSGLPNSPNPTTSTSTGSTPP